MKWTTPVSAPQSLTPPPPPEGTTPMPDYTPDRMADEIIAALDDTYDLVYVDGNSDGFNADQVDAIVRGDFEGLWESTFEWESDSRWHAAYEILNEAADAVAREWGEDDDADDEAIDEVRGEFTHSEAWERARYVVEGRDTGSWVRQLLANTPDVLLRVAVPQLREDHDETEAAGILRAIGAEPSEHNLSQVQDALDNACTDVLVGYWVVRADVATIYDLPADARLEVVNPYLFIGNPFAGAGWVTEAPLHHTITLDRKDLTTDRDAFGYSVHDIFGGLCLSGSEIRAVVA